MRRLLSVAAALTLIASPASAGIRDDYRQQENDAEALRRRCEEIKAKATHFTAKYPSVDEGGNKTRGQDFFVVSGNNLVKCGGYNTTFMEVYEYTLGETYLGNRRQDFEYHLENGELVQYLQHSDFPTIVERRTDIKKMRR